MNVNTENLPGCRVQLALQFEVKDVQAAFGKVYKDLNRQGQVPGFRPGKTPKVLLARHYGEDAIRNMAKYELVSGAVEDAIKDMDLVEPPELPDLEEIVVAEGQPVEVVLTATVGPRVTIGDLSDIEILKPSVDVSEEDVEEVIAELQEAHGEEVKPDRDVVGTGDVVDLQLEITLEGDDAPITDLEESLRVGAGDHFPPIDDKLIGRIVGQTVEMEATYPDDYHDEELAGKTAHIKARIVALRELRLPALDDDFARKVDDEFEGMDDLRSAIRRDIERGRVRFSREQVEEQIAVALMERCEVDLPRVMLLDALQRQDEGALLRELVDSIQDVDSPEQLLSMNEDRLESLVFAHVRMPLALQAIMAELAKQHGIEIGEEDLETQAEIYALESDLELSYVKQAGTVQPDFAARLEGQALRRRVFETVLAGAQVREMPVPESIDAWDAREAARMEAAAAAAAAQDAQQPQDAAAPEDAPGAAEPAGASEGVEGEREEQPAPAGLSSGDAGEPPAGLAEADEQPAVHQSEDGS